MTKIMTLDQMPKGEPGGCPTCSHTMANLVMTNTTTHFGCGRCGTITVVVKGDSEPLFVFTPMLVQRCRQFDEFVRATVDSPSVDHWNGLGIAESINRPENRR